jgi:hypothetical protein
MALEGYLYSGFDPEEEVVGLSDQVVKIAHKVLDHEPDLNPMLGYASKYYFEMAQFLADQEDEETETFYHRDEAEEKFRELYLKVFLKMFPQKDEDDIMEGYNGYDIDWNEISMTRNQLLTLAKVEADQYRSMMNELKRLHAEGVI